MDGLRWLLLIFGLLVVAAVYLYSRRERSGQQADDSSVRTPITADRLEPSLGGTAAVADTSSGGLAPGADEEPVLEGPAQGQKIVALRLVARHDGALPGDELALSLRGIGMRHGKFGIFHRYDGSDENRVIFSAASLVEPGSFDLTNIKDQQIPGISLFLVLPGPIDGAESFDLMMAAARTLSQSLNAELLDESGSTLSIQRERYLREEIIKFQHGIMVA